MTRAGSDPAAVVDSGCSHDPCALRAPPRGIPMKRMLFVTIMLAALWTTSSLASEPKPLTWRTWDAGLREASGAKRPILVDVKDYLSRRFVLIKLNAEAPDAAAYEGEVYTSRSLAARFRVSGFPTTIFLRPGGEH